jgi:hypothetical protein
MRARLFAKVIAAAGDSFTDTLDAVAAFPATRGAAGAAADFAGTDAAGVAAFTGALFFETAAFFFVEVAAVVVAPLVAKPRVKASAMASATQTVRERDINIKLRTYGRLQANSPGSNRYIYFLP